MEYKAKVMDTDTLYRSIKRISHEIVERNNGVENLVLVGIKRRGIPLANIIKENIYQIEHVEVPVCTLDISFYRDDLSKLNDDPKVQKQEFTIDLNNKTVILVDDVIYTGRTVRAAMDAILNSFRPSYIQLAVIVDRGHRELPIRADYIGKNIPTSKEEHINVCVKDIDDEDCVYLIKKA